MFIYYRLVINVIVNSGLVLISKYLKYIIINMNNIHGSVNHMQGPVLCLQKKKVTLTPAV